MPRLTRRSALELGLFSAGAAMSALPSRAHASAADTAATAGASGGNPEHTWGHTIPFGDEYFQNVLPPLESILRTEIPVIDEVSSRMAAVLKDGGNVWYQAKQGHMPRFEFDEANGANPRLLRSNSKWDDGDYDKMRPGDILVTNYVNENVKRAKESGVFIVEVTVCYQDSPEHPRGYIVPNPLGLTQADLADAMVRSYTPYEQGIVRCPEIPEMKICPSSGNYLTAIFWAFQAEVFAKHSGAASTGGSRAKRYFETVIERIRAAYPPVRERLFEAAAVAAKKIAAGAHFHVTSDHGGVQCEATGTASGPMMTNAFRKEMKEGDVHLIAAVRSDAPAALEAIKAGNDVDHYVILVSPPGAHGPRPVDGIWLENSLTGIYRSDHSDAAFYGPDAVGGILNNVLAWCFTAQMVDELVRRGSIPWFWMGFYRQGGAEYNEAVKPLFFRQGF